MRKTLITTALVASAAPVAFANEGAKAARVEPELSGGIFKLDIPERKSKRGSESKYPFASLTEVGTAFGVKNKTAAQLSSIVSNANRKYLRPETDANGNAVYETKEITGADGTKTVVPDNSKPRMVADRHFFALDVDADMKKKIAKTPLDGSSVLVFRDK